MGKVKFSKAQRSPALLLGRAGRYKACQVQPGLGIQHSAARELLCRHAINTGEVNLLLPPRVAVLGVNSTLCCRVYHASQSHPLVYGRGIWACMGKATHKDNLPSCVN